MARITVIENVTLDGVMQAPGAPDEDPRGEFGYGGWGRPYADEVAMRVAARGMAQDGAMLLGRRTYEQLHRAWAGRDDNPFSAKLDATHKYVVSTTLSDPPVWKNSTLLPGDPVGEVTALKADAREDALAILGSGVLVRALLAADLIDELRLSVHPLVLGAGTRLFNGDGLRRPFTVTESVTTTTGVVITTYERATA
jgi:dihydrofolate reductase